MDDLILLLLLLIANGSPIVVRELLGRGFDRPLDGGKVLADGHRLLGPSKTWRGLVAAVLTTTLFALALGWPWGIGVTIGVFAMLGDTASSFIKRRLGLASSTMAPGLDHIPESILQTASGPFLDPGAAVESLLHGRQYGAVEAAAPTRYPQASLLRPHSDGGSPPPGGNSI
jgi:hypothetical protein